MKEEATDVKATVGDIEDWLDRIKQLAEEVRTKKLHGLHLLLLCVTLKDVFRLKFFSENQFAIISHRIACQM